MTENKQNKIHEKLLPFIDQITKSLSRDGYEVTTKKDHSSLVIEVRRWGFMVKTVNLLEVPNLEKGFEGKALNLESAIRLKLYYLREPRKGKT